MQLIYIRIHNPAALLRRGDRLRPSLAEASAIDMRLQESFHSRLISDFYLAERGESWEYIALLSLIDVTVPTMEIDDSAAKADQELQNDIQ